MFLFPPLRQSAGFGARPLKNGGGSFIVTRVNLTRAQLATLDVVSVRLIPGRAGQIQMPVAWSVETNKTVSSGGPAPQYTCRYTGIATDILPIINSDLANMRNFFMVSSAPGFSAASATPSTPVTVEGNDVEIAFNGNPGVLFQATARVLIGYYVIPTMF